jgi:mono/diheme cytochrome c family protein
MKSPDARVLKNESRSMKRNASADKNLNMNNKIAILFLPIAIGVFALVISGCASTGPLTSQQANYPADKVDARGLFTENCIVCHGQNGRAHTFHGWLVGAQNLTNAKWQADTTDSQIINAIKTGPSVMPAFEKKLSPSEIEALAKYVRSFNPTH